MEVLYYAQGLKCLAGAGQLLNLFKVGNKHVIAACLDIPKRNGISLEVSPGQLAWNPSECEEAVTQVLVEATRKLDHGGPCPLFPIRKVICRRDNHLQM